MTINKFVSTLFDCYIKKIVSIKKQKQSNILNVLDWLFLSRTNIYLNL